MTGDFIHRNTAERINSLLDLPATGNEQDWDIELADRCRIKEFIDFLFEHELHLDDKKAVVSLIIASYYDLLEYEADIDSHIWKRIRILLDRNKGAYNYWLNYWVTWDKEHRYTITQILKSYLDEINGYEPRF